MFRAVSKPLSPAQRHTQQPQVELQVGLAMFQAGQRQFEMSGEYPGDAMINGG